ncbi:hypothetical protein [Pontibacter virosus]|uniref:Uncharacterized protein n=1 Tax=Pontibacter virosus TaxID=1765052 RepID=A0A2U1AWT0_9BACT|nr:hypothetical protein [Pontibacter virosus]PVY40853.1 hypothetical protein C8E01_106195 [Pontibacter virosus]
MNRCLYCYQPLPGGEVDFHQRCSKKLFDQATPPFLPYTEEQMEELARQTIRSQIAVTGVQPQANRGVYTSYCLGHGGNRTGQEVDQAHGHDPSVAATANQRFYLGVDRPFEDQEGSDNADHHGNRRRQGVKILQPDTRP